MTSQKGSRFKNFEIMTSSSVFSPQKTYTYQFLDQNDHFIAFYWFFGEFWAILGKIEVEKNIPRGGGIIEPIKKNADRDFLISFEYTNGSIKKTEQNHSEVPAPIFRTESKQAFFHLFHFLGPKLGEGPNIENLNFTSGV